MEEKLSTPANATAPQAPGGANQAAPRVDRLPVSTAELITALVTGTAPPVDPAPFTPARFAAEVSGAR